MRKISVYGEFNKNINISTESAEKSTIYDLLFLVSIYSPKNDNKKTSEMRNQHQSSHFTIRVVFPGLGLILTTGPKLLTYHQIFPNFIFACKLSHKVYKLVKHRVIGFLFQKPAVYKRLGCPDLHTPDMNRVQ